ncbi:hypothetical protein [Nocardioides sp.]|uniref:hypothetical protein n=1 Tax=Nocardioides sp. TaxID=35761 RepID=UPI0025F9573E|nr:hypothetical protein [Nocardioides sp.]
MVEPECFDVDDRHPGHLCVAADGGEQVLRHADEGPPVLASPLGIHLLRAADIEERHRHVERGLGLFDDPQCGTCPRVAVDGSDERPAHHSFEFGAFQQDVEAVGVHEDELSRPGQVGPVESALGCFGCGRARGRTPSELARRVVVVKPSPPCAVGRLLAGLEPDLASGEDEPPLGFGPEGLQRGRRALLAALDHFASGLLELGCHGAASAGMPGLVLAERVVDRIAALESLVDAPHRPDRHLEPEFPVRGGVEFYGLRQ